MVFGKKNHLVGLDIGSAFIKVAELKFSKKGNTLQKYGMSPVEPGTISEGRIMDMEGLAETIRRLFESQKIKEKKVAISTGGHSVVIKTINTAKVPDKELHKTIRSEAEQYIPYDIDDVNIDYQILGDQMNVLLVAVKQDLVAEYIELTHRAGLKPSIIDVDTFALQNIYETLPGNTPGQVTLLLDVGASKTSLNILKNNNSIMMRDMMIGCNQITDTLVEEHGMDLMTCNKVLRGLADPPGGMAEIIRTVTNTWCAEICDVVQTFESSSNDVAVESVVVCGGGAYLDSFKTALGSELDLPVEEIDTFSGTDPGEFSQQELERVKLQAPIALGLAMRRVDDK